MKETTNIAGKTILIKSLKKIKKHKQYKYQWSDADYMDYLCGTVITLDNHNGVKNMNKKSVFPRWCIYPWMVQAIVEDSTKQGVVKFSKGRFIIRINEWDYFDIEYAEDIGSIIGNIYENKDLSNATM